jgi:hypothetical protein
VANKKLYAVTRSDARAAIIVRMLGARWPSD